jgi:hypothetical protein
MISSFNSSSVSGMAHGEATMNPLRVRSRHIVMAISIDRRRALVLALFLASTNMEYMDERLARGQGGPVARRQFLIADPAGLPTAPTGSTQRMPTGSNGNQTGAGRRAPFPSMNGIREHSRIDRHDAITPRPVVSAHPEDVGCGRRAVIRQVVGCRSQPAPEAVQSHE